MNILKYSAFNRRGTAIRELAGPCSYDMDGDVIVKWRSPEGGQPSDADIEAKINEYAAAYPLQELREQRHQLLASTDWWASSDLVMSDERKAYRQALRDLPSGLDTEEKVKNVTWPAKP